MSTLDAIEAAAALDVVAATADEPGVRRRRHVGVRVAAGVLVLLTLLALGADLLPLTDPNSTSADVNRSPGFRFDEPLGTDNLGRSLTARVVYGGRVSIAVTLGATACALVLGVLLGLVAGYFRRAVDSVLDTLLNSMLAFPPLIFLIGVTTILKPSVSSLIVGLGLLGVPLIARVARANTIAVGNREYVTAARAMGMSSVRIMVREVLPNILPSVLSFALVVAASLIVAEGSLSFLGLGIRPPDPSWGGMIATSTSRMRDEPYQMLVPATVFFVTVLSLNTVGNFARARVEGRSA